jgi:uncharacterized protein (TIGR02172 family)
MEAIRINLDDYVHSGEGANGESFFHRTDPTVMMKLYHPGKVQQPLDEMMMARKVFDLGIPSPEPGEYVTDGVRYGIRFRRIEGKVSYSRATADHPEKVAQYAAEFAGMCLDLHKIHVDTASFENVKDRYYRLLAENPFFTKGEKDAIGRFIADCPDTDTAIHGDLQFSNAIFVGDKRYFIDLGDFCYGYSLFDTGMVYLCCCISEPAFIEEVFHMPKSLSVKFWEEFAHAYFGADRSLKDIEEQIRPYAGLKTLIVERDTKRPMPEMRACLKGII